VIIALTAKLIAVPEEAWPRLVSTCERGEPLPPPVGHAATVGALSALATIVGAAITVGASVGGTVVHALAAVAGYVGAAVGCTSLAPMLIRLSTSSPDQVARYASAAVLPLLASGILCVVPLTVLALGWTTLGTILCARSSWIGANAMLGLSGRPRRNATIVVAAVGAVPVLTGIALRILLAP